MPARKRSNVRVTRARYTNSYGVHIKQAAEGGEIKALAWHGKRDVRVDDGPDQTVREPADAIVRIKTTAICGSDLHLYEVSTPFMPENLILGNEPMGVVEEVGSGVTEF